MDGFIRARESCTNVIDPRDCIANLSVDMMGYHDQREIPNYWAYARNFVLQDHMFEPNASWSLPAHLFLVSEWSALCTTAGRSVQLQLEHRGSRPPGRHRTGPAHAAELRVDRPHLPALPPPGELGLLHQEGPRARLRDRRDVLPVPGSGHAHARHLESAAELRPPSARTTSSATSATRAQFYTDVRSGQLPAVSWVIPSGVVSEHPTSSIRTGQAYVTKPDQRDRSQQARGRAPRSSSPGMTGAASTTTSARRPSTSTATASASPAS